MTAETFERELQLRMGRDYRLRWSPSRHLWCIEQQVGRAVYDVPGSDDAAIRIRDGYALCCEIHPTPWMECKECHLRLDLPVLGYGEVRCPYCEMKTGQVQAYFGGYYPLGEQLLQRLERTSPKRAEAWRMEMNRKNRARLQERARDWDNYQDALWGEYYNRLADRPQVGYGGSIKSTGVWTVS